jgi:hypothetical protein
MFGTWFLVIGTAGLPTLSFPVALCLMGIDTRGLHWALYAVWRDDSFWNPKKENSRSE